MLTLYNKMDETFSVIKKLAVRRHTGRPVNDITVKTLYQLRILYKNEGS